MLRDGHILKVFKNRVLRKEGRNDRRLEKNA
jgi:hypothetical protein